MPRLIPSFSSKGFPFVKEGKTKKRKLSEVSIALENTGPHISDAILVSGYDLWHKYLASPTTYFGNKELVIVDSGGYELAPDMDSTEPKYEEPPADSPYGLEQYLEVLRDLPTGVPIGISNFDHTAPGKSIPEQIADAQKLFYEFGQFAHCFILKPIRSGRRINDYIKMDDVIPHLGDMRCFHTIGVTEKELGPRLLDRLEAIAVLRSSMNRLGMDTPIHVWGGLDPVVTPLFFLAGAEIFDGVSWLRYGYWKDTAIPRDAYGALELGLQTQWKQAWALRLGKNLSFLDAMTVRLQRFVDEGGKSFAVLGTQSELIQAGYKTLCTRLSKKVPELKGGK